MTSGNRAGPPPVQNRALAPTVQKDKLALVVEEVGKRSDQFDALVGSDNRERWMTVAIHALTQNSKVLKDCTPLSIVEAIRESAALNLSPTGLLGEGWILPYGDTAKFMPGYRGYLKLLRNSGQIKIADAQIVYMNDDFAVRLGTDPSIHHVPVLYGEKSDAGEYLQERGDYRGAYAWVRLTSGETMVEWMSYDDLMKIKSRSRAGNDGPWVTDPGEMMRKTPIRRIVKRLPLESMPLVAHAATLDEEADTIEGTAVEVPVSAARATAAAYALGRGAAPEENEAQGQPEASAETVEAQGKADPTKVPMAVSVSACGAASPYGDGQSCVLAEGHDKFHKSADKSTWG